ncbi:hypothetical protein IW18_01285 [Flavobacterium hibernum]|uniref:Uncharacterized protein n=1 Tax=Flavobacterium hibernum TaxID=37752 RepID=A0A0D0F053_9FLAO|nr:hypothetical protein IW18_01285 [Flavobacterium hibernum]
MVGRGILHTGLFGFGIKVGIAYFDGHSRGEPLFCAQLVGQLFDHSLQDPAEFQYINRVLGEGVLGGNGLSFRVGLHRGVVDAVGFLPEFCSVFADHLLQGLGGHFGERADGADADARKKLKGFLPHHGDLADGERVQEGLHQMLGDFKVLLLLAFARADFRYGLVDRKGKGEGQARFLCDSLRQLIGPFVASVETVHAGDVEIEFIDAGLFHHGRLFLDDFGNVMGEPRVELHVALHDFGLRAELHGHVYGHGRTHPEFTGFVGAGCHNAPVPAAYDQRNAVKF